MTEQNRHYWRLIPDRQKAFKGLPTSMSIEKSTPLKWEFFILSCAKRFGLTSEIVDNLILFNASGMEDAVVSYSKSTRQIMQKHKKPEDLEQVMEEYSKKTFDFQIALSEEAAKITLEKFSTGNQPFISTNDKSLNIDLSEVLPHESAIRTLAPRNYQALQAYRTLYSMSQAIYLTFIGEANDTRQLFKNNQEIYLSTLSYLTTIAYTGFSQELQENNNLQKGVLASYLLENKASALANIFFTLDLSETAPDIADNQLICHLLSIHSRMLGVIGDIVFLKKLFSKVDLDKLPYGTSPFSKDDDLIKLIYPSGEYNWFSPNEAINDFMPLLLLLKLEGMPGFSAKLNQLVKDKKTALHVAWKNSLRIFADSLHDGINFHNYHEQLVEILRQNKLIPKEGLVIQLNEILEKLVDLKLLNEEQLGRALNPKTYDVPNSFKFRFFVEDESFNELALLLRRDVKQNPAGDGYRPFYLFVDPDDNSKADIIDIDSLENPAERIYEQFEKGGRAMLFIHASFPVLAKHGAKYRGRTIDIQICPISRTKEFADQRIEYGETRLLGKKAN